MRLPLRFRNVLRVCVVLFAAQFCTADVWDGKAFDASPDALRKASDTIRAGKDDEATVLLNEKHFTFDSAGRVTEVRHVIYRIETQEAVSGWSETSAIWAPWNQSKPEIKARVITTDGSVHWLDPKTLSDLPVNENSLDIYTDKRKFGGPLPALAPGAIVEEESVLRETAPFFAAGATTERDFAWSVMVNKTRVVLTYPESLPVKYKVNLLPTMSITKSVADHVETVVFEQGPIPSYPAQPDHLPPDLNLIPGIIFTTGTSWQSVATEYARQTEEKLRLADVQPLMSKIEGRDKSRGTLIRSIVAMLHNNVRYTGIEFDESSLIPQFPAETLKRRYGDCKDKAALLVAMLRSAGIAANLALLDTGPGLDVDPDLPGMGVFDHAIVYIPASGSDPEIWIDATSEYSQVGTLPWADYGRHALVVSAATSKLTQTPELTADRVIHRESREFTMAEYGPAKIVETNEDIGPGEADSRDYYMGDSKQIRKQAEKYVNDMYLADSLTSLEHGNLADLEKPDLVTYIASGRRGSTYLDSATMAIRIEGLFSSLPTFFRTAEDKQDEKADAANGEKPRTADWWINPYTSEWDYKVTAPLGFKVRALPPDKTETIGTLTLSQKYSSNSDGTIVIAVLRVENTQRRLTVAEGKLLRDAVVKASNRDAIFINFDHVGHSLLASGNIKEGLATYEKIAAQHPKEALHKAQLARALLSAGLAERARTVALEGTQLEPNSFIAFNTLGHVLKHDLVGRIMKHGMDYQGAVAAYRKAITLDPKDKDTRADLALLLEYDAEGVRYNDSVSLKQSVEVLRDLKKLDEEYEGSYDDNILFDLWYVGDYGGMLAYAATLPATEVRKGLIVAATTLRESTEVALKKSLEMTPNDQSRSKILDNAAAVLIRARKYPEAAAMLSAAASEQGDEQRTRRVAIISKTRPYTEVSVDPSKPTSVVFRLFGQLLSGNLKLPEYKSMLYGGLQANGELPDEKQFQTLMSKLKIQLSATGSFPVNIADTVVSNMRCTVDGDDASGYKLTIESPGAAAQEFFVALEGGEYKILGYSLESTETETEGLAPIIMAELKKQNLTAARVWLDRARDRIHTSSGDDPLSGALFPAFWTKGQEADANAMRAAALVLLPSKQAGPYLADLKSARDSAKTDMDRKRLTLVIAYVDSAIESWPELLSTSEELMKAEPSSVRAFNLVTVAYRRLQRYDDWEKLVLEKRQKYPDELAYVRSAAELAVSRGQRERSLEIAKTIIDKGKATATDLNLYAWYALFLPTPVNDETLQIAHRASELTQNNNFSILHTVACAYAEAGKPVVAREYLLKAMDAAHLQEPESAVWLGFALIAEQYGITDAAQTMYRRVEKAKFEYAGSNYALAQQHLGALSSAGHVGSLKQ